MSAHRIVEYLTPVASEYTGEYDVDSLRDVVWDGSPYDNLVLPEGERELVFAFADRPRHSRQGFDDFVAHKGEKERTERMNIHHSFHGRG